MSTQENAPTNTTEVILKFLAPSDTNWQELNDEGNNEIMRETIAKKIGCSTEMEKPNIEEFLSCCDAYLQVNDDAEISTFVSLCKAKILEKCSFRMTDKRLIGHTTFLHRLSRRRVRDSRLKLF
jgi:hypothetical protein